VVWVVGNGEVRLGFASAFDHLDKVLIDVHLVLVGVWRV